MSRLELLLLDVYHGVLNHLQECFILGAGGAIGGLAEPTHRVDLFLLGFLAADALHGLAKQKLFGVVRLLLGSTVLIHPVEPLERALGDDSFLDLDKFEIFDLLLFLELLNAVCDLLVLVFFLGLGEPDLLDVLEGTWVPGLFR